MDRDRDRQTRSPVRPPIRTTARRRTTPQRRPASRPPANAARRYAPPRRRRRKKPRRDWTLTVLDFFANIGRGIKRGYLHARRIPHFRVVSAFIGIVLAISASSLIFFAAMRPNALEIYLYENPTPIGAVRLEGNREITQEYITRHATARLETQLGSHVRLISEISANPIRVGTGINVLTFDSLVTALVDTLDYYVWGATIVVDGSQVATLSSQDAAENLLSDIAQSLGVGANMPFSSIFAENIEIARSYVTRAELMTRQEAHSVLTTPRATPGIHIVQRGDSLWGIGQITGMSEGDLRAANPGVDPYSLYVGQRIEVVWTTPALTARGDN